MANNRMATLEVLFTGPEDVERKESTLFLREDGVTVKQYLILRFWDLNIREAQLYASNNKKPFYIEEFYDGMSIKKRMEQAVQIFNGTHSKHIDSYCDSGSFEIRFKDPLMRYIGSIKTEGEKLQALLLQDSQTNIP